MVVIIPTNHQIKLNYIFKNSQTVMYLSFNKPKLAKYAFRLLRCCAVHNELQVQSIKNARQKNTIYYQKNPIKLRRTISVRFSLHIYLAFSEDQLKQSTNNHRHLIIRHHLCYNGLEIIASYLVTIFSFCISVNNNSRWSSARSHKRTYDNWICYILFVFKVTFHTLKY